MPFENCYYNYILVNIFYMVKPFVYASANRRPSHPPPLRDHEPTKLLCSRYLATETVARGNSKGGLFE